MSAEVSPRKETASVWTQNRELNFINGMGTGDSESSPYINRSDLTDWDRLMLRRRLLVRYINALDRRAKWEPKMYRAPLRAHAMTVLEGVKAGIEEAGK